MRHQPALDPAGDAPAGTRRPGRAERREAWCPMLDGSVQAVTVADWRQGPGNRWQCLLVWGTWGVLEAGWYWYDDRLAPIGGSA